MKLLIAEDDLTLRVMLAAIVGKWGYELIIVDGLHAGSNDYIAKPFENIVLHARIKSGIECLNYRLN